MDLNVVTKALLESDEGFNVTQSDESLIITNDVGINAVLVVQGSQIIVESLLFQADAVADQAALDDYILKTHKLVPLTAVGKSEVEGQFYYSAFGALSSESKVESVVLEVEELFRNVAELLEGYSEFLIK
ncbi:DUF2170 family protein [Vibrio cholerae]|uniref:Cytoplasmic protein n=2 Tax=Vibrio parahaemolyticus TaxID=670 RepID=A0A1B1LS37_VIBPH|nr:MULTISPECIES: DUF2170 family protein [Vibrio]ANS55863.1 cytoplasmic protein [Vibrio parahaemolyticus]EJL6492297.1 DUF2170 family protein [Vibrio cholerae]EJL6644163.1 DUF2170 family protein [Vibrio cholerae]MCA2422541.1 YjfI family protein [Vibrio alginolyticus]MCA2447205.1 YjfI family protein [Vibrio alginolyticus]